MKLILQYEKVCLIVFLVIGVGSSQAEMNIYTYDYFHPNSILEVKQENNTRIYTFNMQKTKNIFSLYYTGIATYDPFPLIFDDKLILVESVEELVPINYGTTRCKNILTSLSISTGKVVFAREIFQPVIHPYLTPDLEFKSCNIHGVFKWRDRIVVLITYNNSTKDTPLECERPHVYIYDQRGFIVASYNLEGFDYYGLGVDETTDRLIISDNYLLHLGSPTHKDMVGQTPQILQMDLNTGEIVARNDFYHCIYEPFDSKGFLYRLIRSQEIQYPSMPKIEMIECYSMNPFRKIWEKSLTNIPEYRFDRYWKGFLWSFYSDDSTGIPTKKYQAHDPQTLEPVETEENPYYFIHVVDGVSYRIEYIEENPGDLHKRNISIRITNLGADVENWPEH